MVTRQVLGDGRHATTGPKVLMVPQISAAHIGDEVPDFQSLPSTADHRGLVRFDHTHDDRYRDLIGRIRNIAATAPPASTLSVRSRNLSRGISHNTTEPVKNFVSRSDLEDQIKRQLHDSITVREDTARILVVYGRKTDLKGW